MSDLIKLIGVVIIVIGFILKFDVLAVVLVAGLATGLVSGLSIFEILTTLGESFVKNRLMSIFLISFPVIALIEHYGLKEQAAHLIGKLKSATGGGVLVLYTWIRTLAAAFSVRLGGHVQFIRPLVLPMAAAAAENKKGEALSEEEEDEIKGLAAASENYGNFFGQNIYPASSGVLMIVGTLTEAGYQVTQGAIGAASIWAGIAMLIVSTMQFLLFDRKIMKGKVQ